MKEKKGFSYFSTLVGLLVGVLLVSCSKEGLSEGRVQVIRFAYQVNTSSEGKNLKESLETNQAVLILPSQYVSRGLPTRLLVYCHSGGGIVSASGCEAEGIDFVQYFVSQGYAVLDAGSFPDSYARRLKIDAGRNVGSPVALRAFLQAYREVMAKYNLKKDGCFVFSNSNGGLLASNIVNLTNVPVLGQSGVAPLLSIEKNAWSVPSGKISYGEFSQYQNRSNIIRVFGMNEAKTQEELNKAPYEKKKVGKYDPFDYCMNQTKIPYKTPYLMFLHPQDGIIDYKLAQDFCAEMTRRGGTVTLSGIVEYGGHWIKPTPVVVGQFEYQGRRIDIRQTVKAAYDFFHSLEPKGK